MDTPDLDRFLDLEWLPSFGCTEPGAVGYAAALAADLLGAPPERLQLIVDPRLFKNGFAVGVPNSGGQVGLRWAAALGAVLAAPARRLEIFAEVPAADLARAAALLERDAVGLEVDYQHDHLRIELLAEAGEHRARVLIENEHTGVVELRRDGELHPLPPFASGATSAGGGVGGLRAFLAAQPLTELVALAAQLEPRHAQALRRGLRVNQDIAQRGLDLLPRSFIAATAGDLQSQVGRLAAAGVYARMGGADLPVYTVGGSGNKGITASVPLYVWARETGKPDEAALQAVALSLLITSSITSRLGSLSAICGCSNAAGIGVACGLVHLQGGGRTALHLAVNNMVGCIAGMICDGAKLGCALKTFASVDTAFRSATLAMAGVGIPAVEGIVGDSAEASLANLGRLSRRGMIGTDGEILRILEAKAAQP